MVRANSGGGFARALTIALSACLGTVVHIHANAQQDANPTPATLPSTRPTVVDYDSIIAELDSDDPAARRAASLRLGSMGGEALPLVAKAVADPDRSPESLARLRRALPLLEARARRESRVRERFVYLSRAWADAYARAGSDPKWDRPATTFLEQFRTQQHLVGPSRDAMLAQLQQAIDAGCRNELVLIAAGRVVDGDVRAIPQGVRVTGWQGKLRKYLATDAPAAVRLTLCIRADSTNSAFLAPEVEGALRAFKELLADPAVPPGLADDLANDFFKVLSTSRDLDVAQAASKFGADYAAVEPADRPGRHLFLAEAAIRKAWQARGNGWANTVTPEGWKVFGDELRRAQSHLESAWKLDPEDPRVGETMIVVCMGLNSDAATVEQWYRRSVQADPDHYAAASRKLYLLYPRWHGSHAAMLEFGHECLATENWRGGLPFILVKAHQAIAAESGDEKAYFLQPTVYNDIKRVYEGYLLNVPEDSGKRSEFARMATRAEQWTDAHEQFQILNDAADYSVFGGKATYDYLKRKAARLAKADAPAKP